MKKAHLLVSPNELPETYEELVALHVPRPIHDRVSYENTVAVVDAIAGAQLNKDQDDYLEILSQLIETYEDAHVKPPRRVAGIKLVRFLLAENDMTGDDLAGLLGVDRSAAYKILKGTRNLTAEHVRKIADRFVISADALIG
jgi:HTH-type transcriptional regulator / antitoxin HigA